MLMLAISIFAFTRNFDWRRLKFLKQVNLLLQLLFLRLQVLHLNLNFLFSFFFSKFLLFDHLLGVVFLLGSLALLHVQLLELDLVLLLLDHFLIQRVLVLSLFADVYLEFLLLKQLLFLLFLLEQAQVFKHLLLSGCEFLPFLLVLLGLQLVLLLQLLFGPGDVVLFF